MGEDWLPWKRPRKVVRPVLPGMTCKPWSQNRLPSQAFPKHKREELKFPSALDGRRWVFVKAGQDDFRTGRPPPCQGLITRGAHEVFLPTITHWPSRLDYKKILRNRPKNANPYSSLSLAQQARRAFVERTEASLAEHPLAVWPLEEDMSQSLLREVLEELDPHRTMEDKWAYCEGSCEVPKKPSIKEEETPVPQPSARFPGQMKYGALSPKKPKTKKDESTESASYPFVPEAVRDFCEWVNTFGDLGIDEDYLVKQFDLGYHCKPTYTESTVKNVSVLPSDLRHCRRLSKVKEIRFSIQEANYERKLQKPRDPYKPTKEKIRYGAWYLKPSLWKKLVNDEPLLDPKEILDYEMAMYGKPDILEDLYGTIAFKDFIISKGYSMPGILERLFMRKGWDYDTVNTPIPRALKAHELIMQQKDEDYDDEND